MAVIASVGQHTKDAALMEQRAAAKRAGGGVSAPKTA